MKVEGAVALVTGANRGLGAAIADALLDAGATVYGAARDPRSITNDRVLPIRLDVTNDDDVARAARECGDVSILVNNAGILRCFVIACARRRRGGAGRAGDELLRFDADGASVRTRSGRQRGRRARSTCCPCCRSSRCRKGRRTAPRSRPRGRSRTRSASSSDSKEPWWSPCTPGSSTPTWLPQ